MGIIKRFLPPSWKETIKRNFGLGFYDRSKPYLRVPGMISLAERENLSRIGRECLTGRGQVVEFGAFLGASSAAILAGLSANKRFTASGAVHGNRSYFHIYDVFRTPSDSFFARLTREYAYRGGVSDQISEDSGWLDFYAAFETYVDTSNPVVVVHRGLVCDLAWTGEPIEFLHLDLPKDWGQAIFIVRETFSSLLVGAHILHQDFVYHWSAELIAMVGVLCSRGAFKPQNVTDSTLTGVTLRAIDKDDVAALIQIMQDPMLIEHSIDAALRASEHLLDSESALIIRIAKAVHIYRQIDRSRALTELSHIVAVMRELALQSSPCSRALLALKETFEFGMEMPTSWE